MWSFLDKIPYAILIIIAALMLLAPFKPMPHVVEKLIMLKNGVLTKPIVFPALRALLARWLPEAPSSVAAPAPPASTHAPLDEARIVALVAEIMPMLAQNQFVALARVKALQDMLAGTAAAPEMADIGHVLQEFRFDLALDRLRRMAATYHWEEPVHD